MSHKNWNDKQSVKEQKFHPILNSKNKTSRRNESKSQSNEWNWPDMANWSQINPSAGNFWQPIGSMNLSSSNIFPYVPSGFSQCSACPQFEFPKFEFPKFECPKYEYPKYEYPKFECQSCPPCPQYEFPKFDCPACPSCPKYEFPKFECPTCPSCPQMRCNIKNPEVKIDKPYVDCKSCGF